MASQSELTSESFAGFVARNRFAVVHFYAVWNGYDRQMRTMIAEDLPAEISDVVAFAALNVDDPVNLELCKQHKIRNIPWLEFYSSGELRLTHMHLPSLDVFRSYLRDLTEN